MKRIKIFFYRNFYKFCLVFICGVQINFAIAWDKPFLKPSAEKLKEYLPPLVYEVTQNNGTEAPFKNEFNAFKEDGIYVDILSGEPLFSSTHKFDSGTGWPSFTQTLEEKYVVEKADNQHGMQRTEVRSKLGNNHLGHVFDDGPLPTKKRYCINSAALKFVPAKNLKSLGYQKYESLFSVGIKKNNSNQKQISEKKQTPNHKAVFAGGCFWCSEADFEKMKLSGIINVRSGYAGDIQENALYDKVSEGKTNHAEAFEIEFNSEVISYAQLVELYWKTIDPTVENKQFCDEGKQYRTAIFPQNAEQKAVALKSLENLKNSKKFPKIFTQVEFPKIAQNTYFQFFPAEEYHQDFFKKNPARYNSYRAGCKRDSTLLEIWK
jgi:peptide methionine sulfoxide reductase msrA/msrB